MRKIENLVLKGGGILGTAYAGAYSVLEQNKIIGFAGDAPVGEVKKIAGNSAGAIFAALIALGYSAAELNKIVLELDFTSFLDFDANDLKNGGLLKGNKFENWIREKVNAKMNVNGDQKSADFTFGDLDKRINSGDVKFKDLHIYSLSLETHNTVHFSAKTTPNTPIASAVRASMSIPLIFQPYKMPEKSEYAGTLFVDGGVKYNYPITAFDENGPNYNTLGLDLTNFAYKTEEEDTWTLIYHLLCSELKKRIIGMDAEASKNYDEIELALESIYNYWQSCKNLIDHPVQHASGTGNQLFSDFTTKFDVLTSGIPDYLSIIKFLEKYFKKNITPDLLLELFIIVHTTNLAELSNPQPIIDRTGDDSNKKTDDPEMIRDVINSYLSVLKPLSVLIQTQENMVLDRDSNRTIYLDCLGMQFTDFGIPDYNKWRLIYSGRKCTQLFLNMIMY